LIAAINIGAVSVICLVRSCSGAPQPGGGDAGAPTQFVTQGYIEHAEGLEHPGIDEPAGIDGGETKSLRN
jgi:hypothetical protein